MFLFMLRMLGNLVVVAALQSPRTESSEKVLQHGLFAIYELAIDNHLNRAKLGELGACAGQHSFILVWLVTSRVTSCSAVAQVSGLDNSSSCFIIHSFDMLEFVCQIFNLPQFHFPVASFFVFPIKSCVCCSGGGSASIRVSSVQRSHYARRIGSHVLSGI